MLFDAAQSYLLSLGNEVLAMKLGLENVRHLLARLGNPQFAYSKIQIAGTNGKGSTAAMIDGVARASKIRTGLYTSPHLESITERIKIDGAEISREDFAQMATTVRAAAEQVRSETGALPTFFEQVTAIALAAFREAKIEFAILETGLGGRLDAVTATEADIAVITPVALDHQQYLGTTLAEIAGEKAAVINHQTKSAIIALQAESVRQIIANRAAQFKVATRFVDAADLHVRATDERGQALIDVKTKRKTYTGIQLNLAGRHQAANAQVAIESIESLSENLGLTFSDNAIRQGLSRVAHPGRLEWFDKTTKRPAAVLLDGAHNVAGAESLRDYLHEFVADKSLTLVFGAMRDKDVNQITALLFPLATNILITCPANARAATTESLASLAAVYALKAHVEMASKADKAFEIACRIAARQSGIVVVAGSLYLVGEIRRHLTTRR